PPTPPSGGTQPARSASSASPPPTTGEHKVRSPLRPTPPTVPIPISLLLSPPHRSHCDRLRCQRCGVPGAHTVGDTWPRAPGGTGDKEGGQWGGWRGWNRAGGHGAAGNAAACKQEGSAWPPSGDSGPRRQWLADALKENDPSNVILFLVGSKKDLSTPAQYSLMEKDALKVAQEMQAEYWAVSSLTGGSLAGVGVCGPQCLRPTPL
uniref:Uncharacterized protein n=1 Tax=Calidris pygmaea TaxID=425635 RepID=A0A8C3JL78_9CHAR